MIKNWILVVTHLLFAIVFLFTGEYFLMFFSLGSLYFEIVSFSENRITNKEKIFCLLTMILCTFVMLLNTFVMYYSMFFNFYCLVILYECITNYGDGGVKRCKKSFKFS